MRRLLIEKSGSGDGSEGVTSIVPIIPCSSDSAAAVRFSEVFNDGNTLLQSASLHFLQTIDRVMIH